MQQTENVALISWMCDFGHKTIYTLILFCTRHSNIIQPQSKAQQHFPCLKAFRH